MVTVSRFLWHFCGFCSKKVRNWRFLVVAFLIVFFSAVLPAQSADKLAVPGQYLVKFKKAPALQALSDVRDRLRVRKLNDLQLTKAELVTTVQGQALDDEYAKELLARGVIEYIEPNYIVSIYALPNDSFLSQLWGMNNTGQTGGTADVDIDAPEAWNLTTGSTSVVVGIVDTGVDYRHPDLAANMWVNPHEIPGNGIDDDGNGVIDDVYGYNALANSGNPLDDHSHGSHVAGTIGGVGNNGSGVVGVNWNVKIMALKFLSASGSGTTADAIKAIDYAVQMKTAGVNLRVLSNSWGGGGYSAALEDAISAANDAGILFVAAAGNSALDTDASPNYPSGYTLPNVVSVAAIDRNGNLAAFSNYGETTVDLAAPGVDILSTVLGGQYDTYSGTSMATPHVSGVAALVAGQEPGLSVTDLKNRLLNTVKPLATLNGLMVSPGILDAYNAVTGRITPRPPSQPTVRYTKRAIGINYDADLGTRVLQIDDGYTAVDLAFSFSFYNQAFHRIAISSNGRVIPLGDSESVPTTPDYSNRLLPGISPFHDDLYPAPDAISNATGGVWYKTSPSQATITWVVVNYGKRLTTDPTALIQFQLKLSSSGDIQMHYADTYSGDSFYDYGASATVGLSPPAGSSGEKLQVTQNAGNPAEIGNNKALDFRITEHAVKNDFDGDKKSDIIVWHPATGVWSILRSASNFDRTRRRTYQLGIPGDIPITGDFDGDGKTDLAVWRPINGNWYFRKSSTSRKKITSIQWGLPGDIPLVGDFDGDSRTDICVYRPSDGVFYALLSSANFNRSQALLGNIAAMRAVALGGRDSQPLVGNFVGDAADDFATIARPVRYFSAKDTNGAVSSLAPWGTATDLAIACDWNNDGTTDRVVIRVNAQGTLDWYILTSTGKIPVPKHFGLNGDVPSCDRDFDGDGKHDISVYRPKTAEWFIHRSSTGKHLKKNLLHRRSGAASDVPL